MSWIDGIAQARAALESHDVQPPAVTPPVEPAATEEATPPDVDTTTD